MIPSLCDTDFYKLTMMQVVLHRHAGAGVRYAFKWRNWDEMQLKCTLKDFKINIDEKIDNLCELRFHADELNYLLSHCADKMVGTSNIHFAMMLGSKPIGTMAHEFIQAHQQLGPRLNDSQKVALQSWADEYRGELGIALSDTMGFDKFLKVFDRFFSLLFDGCRQDSGNPVRWTEKLIAPY